MTKMVKTCNCLRRWSDRKAPVNL
uniref:Uncharacterized protein n=1 Tax=Anguilla anguilla TaxID=7936 RepID=A0A0E9QUX3_ANGAN